MSPYFCFLPLASTLSINLRHSLGGVAAYSSGKDAASVLNLNDGGDEARWQGLYWTKQTYAELLETKNKYDRSGLLFCHHCVGSERWDASGTCEVGLNATSIDR